MTEDRIQKISAILQENDSKEIPFYDTKTALLKQGYSDDEISIALLQRPYDGKKDVKITEDPVTAAFRKNPELAEQVGSQILEDDKKDERNQAIVTGVASQFAVGRHAQSKYQFEFSELLGLPYFKIFFGGVLIFVVVTFLGMPVWINTIFSAIIILWIVHSFYTHYMKK